MYTEQKIPKIIHYCWFGGGPKPESVCKCIESWKQYCPDYEIREWNESNVDISINEYTRQAFEMKAWGFVPDYLRLWIVYTYGGIYLDTDVQVIRCFDPLLNEDGFAGFEDNESVALGLGFGAKPGNPVIWEQMRKYDSLQFIRDDGSLNRTASPKYSTEVMKLLGVKPDNGTVQRIDHFTCYPVEYFCPKDFRTGKMRLTENTFSIHHYDSSWWTEEQKLAGKIAMRLRKVLPEKLAKRLAKVAAILRCRGVAALKDEIAKFYRKRNSHGK